MRRLAVLVILLLATAGTAAAQSEPRLTVTAVSNRCDGGLPVVDYDVTNQWTTAASVTIWWVADASVYGIAASHDLGPAPDGAAGSFTLPFGFYATVTVFATATWPDGAVTTNASWAIPVADCAAPTPPPSSVPEPTPTAPTTTIDDGGNGNGNGNNGNGNGPPTTAETG